ncbi:pentatricopeptide repeat-containing protein [Gossypium australe]|uniref:Pentatricopeptide repeat-containing protein n=1 Tax=Gossypium australe TaxID=47621 RepID=A0A5B6V3C6_9ROSI|nr:pentatricopeptide repeat-containing protein [Gossypium australe]
MIRSYSSGELSRESFQPHILVLPSKFPPLHFPCVARAFTGFKYNDPRFSNNLNLLEPGLRTSVNFYSQMLNSRGCRFHLEFKLHCHSKTLFLPARSSSSNVKKKRYGGVLPSILRSLDSDKDLDKTLASVCENLSPKEQTVVLKEQRNCERLIRVFEFFKSLKDYVPNVIHYNIVLRALGRAQKWDKLRLCWIEMAKNGVLPTNNTYGMLVDVYGKAGMVKEALLWIKHMRLRGLYPDEVTMNTVVRVLKDAGDFDRADRFYKDWCIGRVDLNDIELDSMIDLDNGSGSAISFKQFLSTELFRTGGRSPVSGTSGSPDTESSVRKPRLTSTYNTLIDLYGKAGRLKDAADVFAEMLKSGVAIDTITFNTMIFTCGSHGHLLEAESLLAKMEERGISPDTKTYNIFLSLYAGAGNIEAALEYYRKIRKVGLFPDIVTHRAVLHILCERNMVQEAETVIKEMEEFGIHIDEQSLPVIIKMYIAEGLLDRAKMLFEKFILDHELSSKTSAAIIDAYAERGLWSEAEAVFYGKRDSSRQNRSVLEYNVMVKAYGKAELYDKAYSLFKSMRNHGTWPDECTFNSLIQMFSGGDLVDHARDLLGEMRAAGLKPKCQTYSSLIACYARLGQLSDAVDVYQEMISAGVKPNEVVFGSLINGFAETGGVEEALQYFRMMEESGISANKIVLTSLIKAYTKVGCLEGAKRAYEKIKDLEGGPDIVASNSMLNLYADLGMVSEARCVFDNLKENGGADGFSFAAMMYLYKSMGMLDEAIDVADEMKQSGLLRDCSSYNKVMACYVTNGQLRGCGELLHEMINRKILPDMGTFNVLLTSLKKGGIPIEAVTQLESSYQGGKPYARQAVIITVFSLVGLHAYALKSCDAIIKAEIPLESFVYNAMIYAYGSSGQIDKALNIFMKMKDDGLEPDIITYINLVSCYGKAGMLEGVKRIYSQLKYGEIEPNESLFKAVMDAYKDANKPDLAELVNQEMKFAFEGLDYSESEVEGESESEDIVLDL